MPPATFSGALLVDLRTGRIEVRAGALAAADVPALCAREAPPSGHMEVWLPVSRFGAGAFRPRRPTEAAMRRTAAKASEAFGGRRLDTIAVLDFADYVPASTWSPDVPRPTAHNPFGGGRRR